MNEGEKDRRLASLVHTVFLASIGVYLVLIVVARRGGAAPQDPTGKAEILAFWLLAIAAAEYSWASWLGRRHLARGSGDAVARVRSYFYLRFGAAEAAALFGLMLGFLGGGVVAIGLLFALSAAALWTCAPSPGRWAAALAEAAGSAP